MLRRALKVHGLEANHLAAGCGGISRNGIDCFTYSLETYNKVPWTSAEEREREMLTYNGSIRVSGPR